MREIAYEYDRRQHYDTSHGSEDHTQQLLQKPDRSCRATTSTIKPARYTTTATHRRITTSSLLFHAHHVPGTVVQAVLDANLTFHVCISRFKAVRHSSVVMSCTRVFTLGMARMGSKSTPRMMLPRGMNFAATWHHPPGAAQRSMQTFAEPRKSYFLLI